MYLHPAAIYLVIVTALLAGSLVQMYSDKKKREQEEE
jgi:hypothetical protein